MAGDKRLARRTLLAMGIAAAPPVLLNAESKLKVVIAGGHPGDPEYGCGGTAALYAVKGHKVVLLYLNHGERTCPEKTSATGSLIRTGEAQRACEILKARPLFALQCDGHAVVDATHYDEFRALIETERPDLLFTQWPIDGHRDHRAVSTLAYDAWLAMKKSFGFYYYEVSNGEDTLMFSPTDYVDITNVEARKRSACYAHVSQSPDRFYALQSQVTRFRGLESGHAHAEGFIRHAQSPRALLP